LVIGALDADNAATMPLVSEPAPVPDQPLLDPSALAPPPAPVPALKLGLRHHLLALSFALLGGPLGIVGAVFQEVQAGAFAVLAAGIIEEAIKPAGVYILLIRWPHVLRGRYYTASLAALSGLVFALIEAAVYIFLYFPEGSSDFVAYRLTIPLVMHTLASFIFGLGIKRGVIDWANGVAPFPRDSRNFMFAAMALHGTFNLVAVILALSGVIDFDSE